VEFEESERGRLNTFFFARTQILTPADLVRDPTLRVEVPGAGAGRQKTSAASAKRALLKSVGALAVRAPDS
jgi:hypothetical protein